MKIRSGRTAGNLSTIAVLLLFPAATGAGDPETLLPLTAACETALALSAAPDHLQAAAGVYLLGDAGFELSRKTENGFLCLVERNHPQGIIPQCFDRASKDANLAVVLDEARDLRAGKTFAELRDQRKAALAAGKYPTAGPGLVYMVSDYNYIYNPQRDAIIKAEPHIMYHAPHLTDADIGGDRGAALSNRGLPFINAQGAHGFMIGFTEKGSDSAAIERHCAGQLPDTSSIPRFPPPR